MERCDVRERLKLRPVNENHDEYVAERVVMVLDDEGEEELEDVDWVRVERVV